MKTKKINSNSISIKTKIALGFLFCFLLFIIQFIFSKNTLQTIERNIEELSVLSSSSSRIQGINKDVTDIQRLVLAYGQTGSDTLLRKLESNLREIDQNLHSFEKVALPLPAKEKLKSLQAISSRYKGNIKSLKSLNNQRIKYTKTDLKKSFEITKKKIVDATQSLTDRALLVGELYTMYFYAQDFLNNKTYPSKQKLYITKKNCLQLLKRLSSKKTRRHLQEQLNQFSNIFEKAVIANRNYLSLVNVVMSGDATEFSVLTSSLEEEILQAQSANRTKTEQQLQSSLKFSLIAISLLIPLLIFITIYYNQNISLSLAEISTTFTKFIDRDFTAKVPGLNRGDEIGQLAKAAEEFKSVSQLLQKEKLKAQELTQIKSDFLANMSHEIRTPMNGIMGMVDHLLETKIAPEQKEMLDTINSCGNSLTTILNDILDLSKVESGKMDLEHIPVNMPQFVEEVRFLFQPKAHQKQIDYNVTLTGDELPRFFFGDVTRLKQIVINLLSNAFKFTDKGEVSLIIDTHLKQDDRAIISFSVKDSGIGINEKKQGLIFEEFSQSDSSTTREYGGTGLGLAISQQLALLMNSKIELQSEETKGSTFSFKLEVECLTFHEKTQLQEEAQRPMVCYQSGHCLVVEDNEINVKVITLRLKKMGITFDIANNGLEAVELSAKAHFDMIFMDLQMPVMDGLTATREIRQKGNTTPIIAMTANVQSSDKVACEEAGMNYFLGKPVKKEDLEATVEEILKLSSSLA